LGLANETSVCFGTERILELDFICKPIGCAEDY
jgi:hypothetical protein